jgi:hypothetical protein
MLSVGGAVSDVMLVTQGFEKHVGSRTTFRMVTTPFLAYNEAGEAVLHAPRSDRVR